MRHRSTELSRATQQGMGGRAATILLVKCLAFSAPCADFVILVFGLEYRHNGKQFSQAARCSVHNVKR